MKLKLFACLVASGLAMVTQAVAAPDFEPFLSVDINGYNAGNPADPQLGPTEPGFQEWRTIQGFDPFDPAYDPAEDWGNSGAAGLTKVFATSEGNVTANLRGVGIGSPIARNRGGAGGGPLAAMYQDLAFMTRSSDGFGQAWIRLQLSGLSPGQSYEFTGFAYEPFNGGNLSFQGWTDLATLGGLDGPGVWMDANFDPDPALYQPTDAAPDPGVYKNPIPTIVRSLISGPNIAMDGDPYTYAATFRTTADAGGNIVLYTWADPESYSNTQTAAALNGFQLGIAPEPTSFVMLVLGFIGFASLRRRDG